MSEFKFACPVCGQHITADSEDTGSQLECPTCFRKIVVPQAPASENPKFILSAAQADKPRPPQASAGQVLEPIQRGPKKTSIPIALVVLVVFGVAGAVMFAFRNKIFPTNPPPTEATATNAAPIEQSVPPMAPGESNLWALDLSSATFPDAIVYGKIAGKDFLCDLATAQGGTLTLRAGTNGPMDPGLTINLSARRAEELSGKSVNITTNAAVTPRVTLRWMDGDQPVMERFTGGYALKIEFGAATGGRLPGKIYLCLSDRSKSYVLGNFNAEIRNPPPSKKSKQSKHG
jgi:hypothetical protein